MLIGHFLLLIYLVFAQCSVFALVVVIELRLLCPFFVGGYYLNIIGVFCLCLCFSFVSSAMAKSTIYSSRDCV